jgi:hypothetical protein
MEFLKLLGSLSEQFLLLLGDQSAIDLLLLGFPYHKIPFKSQLLQRTKGIETGVAIRHVLVSQISHIAQLAENAALDQAAFVRVAQVSQDLSRPNELRFISVLVDERTIHARGKQKTGHSILVMEAFAKALDHCLSDVVGQHVHSKFSVSLPHPLPSALVRG